MIGSRTLVKMVSGLRPILSRSRRIIDQVFLIVQPPSASRRHRHPEARAEEATLARWFVAQPPSGEADEDILERHPFQLDRRNLAAGVFDFANELGHRVSAVVGRNDDRTLGIARDVVDAGLSA